MNANRRMVKILINNKPVYDIDAFFGRLHIIGEKRNVSMIDLFKYEASDWSRWPSRPIRSLRYIVTCTRIRPLLCKFTISENVTLVNPSDCIVRHDEADITLIRGAPFDFWGGGGARLLLSIMFFFSEKLANNFFFSTDLETNIFFVPGKKIKHFFCDSSYLIKCVDKCHALTLMKVSL